LALLLAQTPTGAAASGSAKWEELSPSAHPGPRYYSAMAYDGSHRLVLFGGYYDGTGFLDDTWVFNGTAWMKKDPAHHPSARDGASMIYDSVSQSVILFGGEDGNTFADTWSWDGNDWTQLFPAQSPPKRAWAGLATSPRTDQPILFGGLDSTGLSDTWTWDGHKPGVTWTPVTTAHSPTPRSDFPMAFDPVTRTIVLFGGGLWNGENLTTEYGDTWTFDGTDWTQAATTGPAPRVNAHAAFDPRVGRVLLFGGSDYNSETYYQDNWVWTGAVWAPVSLAANPSPRDTGVMAYLPEIGKTVLFGGFEKVGTNLGDTWVLTFTAGTEAPALSTTVSATDKIKVSWSAPGAPLHYVVQYSQRTKNGSGDWVDGDWQPWDVVGPNTHTGSLNGAPGGTYRFRAKANYGDGSSTGFSAPAMTVVPLDDRSSALDFGDGWKQRSADGRYQGTVTDTSSAHKRVTIETAVHEFTVIGDTCADCGAFKVFIDGDFVEKVDTHASSTHVRQALFSQTFNGTKKHTLKIKALGTDGHPKVRIDAIGVER
jgi:hypothetical protein